MPLFAHIAALLGWFVAAIFAAFVLSRVAGLVWRHWASGPVRHILANGSSAAAIVALRLLDGSGPGELDVGSALGLYLAAQIVCLTVDLLRERGGTGERRPSARARPIDLAALDGGPSSVPPRHPVDGVRRASIGRAISGLGRAVGRHWRGEYPLWGAFWVTGLLAGLVAGVLEGLVEVAGGLVLGDSRYRLALTFALGWSVMLLTAAWYTVGVWRTANRYLADRRSLFWARSAKLAVILGVIGIATEIATIAYPQLVEAGKIAFFDDPDIADFSVAVTHDGRAVEIAGGIKYGLARELERVLRALPDVEVLRLHSNGGRVHEAVRLFALVRRFELDTYVHARCLSACTIVFAASRERWLRRGARLGYHGVAFPGSTAEELQEGTSAANEYLLAAGVAPDFVARAGRVPNASMWYPTVAELLAAGAVTSVVGDDVLALRHADDVTEAAIAAQLRADASLYATMAVRAPEDFRAAVAIVADGFAARRADALITRELRLHLHAVARRYRAGTDAATLLAVAAAEAELLGILRSADRELCYAYGRGTADLAAVVDHLPLDRLPQEQALAEQILQTNAHRAPVDSTTSAAGRHALRERMLVLLGPDTLALLERDKLEAFERRRSCDVYLALYAAVFQLDRATAATLLRQRFAEW